MGYDLHRGSKPPTQFRLLAKFEERKSNAWRSLYNNCIHVCFLLLVIFSLVAAGVKSGGGGSEHGMVKSV